MPRTFLSRKADTRRDLEAEIRQSMREKKITQDMIGERLGVTGAAVSYKIKKLKFDYTELVEVMDILSFSPEKILYFASGGRFKKTGGENDKK